MTEVDRRGCWFHRKLQLPVMVSGGHTVITVELNSKEVVVRHSICSGQIQFCLPKHQPASYSRSEATSDRCFEQHSNLTTESASTPHYQHSTTYSAAAQP